MLDFHLSGTIKKDTESDHKGGTLVEERRETALKEPPLYKVLLHNDDFTPQDFVIDILRRYFKKNYNDAYEIMMNVHLKGIGICGVFPREIAETKVKLVLEEAVLNEYPLRASMELD